jgi:hypothetical protein
LVIALPYGSDAAVSCRAGSVEKNQSACFSAGAFSRSLRSYNSCPKDKRAFICFLISLRYITQLVSGS